MLFVQLLVLVLLALAQPLLSSNQDLLLLPLPPLRNHNHNQDLLSPP
jgi:hypothetical protein